MTRPMPGPPDPMPHEDSARPHDSAAAPWNYCSGCAAENRLRLADPKRLTDAECYDEWGAFEQVESYGLLCIEMGDKRMTFSRFEREANESETWHRFATRPHALEEA